MYGPVVHPVLKGGVTLSQSPRERFMYCTNCQSHLLDMHSDNIKDSSVQLSTFVKWMLLLDSGILLMTVRCLNMVTCAVSSKYLDKI